MGNKDFFKSSQIRVKSNNLKFLSSQIRVKSNSLKKLSSQICVKSNNQIFFSSQIRVKSNNQNFFSSQIWVKSNILKNISSQIRVKSNNAKKLSSQIRVKSNIFDLTPIFDLRNAPSNNLPTPTLYSRLDAQAVWQQQETLQHFGKFQVGIFEQTKTDSLITSKE